MVSSVEWETGAPLDLGRSVEGTSLSIAGGRVEMSSMMRGVVVRRTMFALVSI